MTNRENDNVVETRGLTRRYGTITAVDHLDLTIRHGEIYGFLGANGAGKTTTLRMLLGLIKPDEGAISVLGHPAGHPEGLAKIGSMIESPAFWPHLTGRENLQVLARYAGVPFARIDSSLKTVELQDRANDAFRGYSLGMKQRLGVASALLKDPDLLILDEPTNGLDPAGMASMRALIRELGAAGHTVLLSSHLMQEVEQICDRVGIIGNGRLVAEGTVDDLRGTDSLVVHATPQRAAHHTLAAMKIEASANGNELRVPMTPDIDVAAINARLVADGIAVRELRRDRASLESIFLALTGSPKEPASKENVITPAEEVSHVG